MNKKLKKYLLEKLWKWALKEWEWYLFDETGYKKDVHNFQIRKDIEVVFHNPLVVYQKNVIDVSKITTIQFDDTFKLLAVGYSVQ